MIKWIEKTIDPPDLANKNRFAVFSTIGGIADTVRADALKAFNAHFPYLADGAKLEEHGAALLVPRLLDDTEKEYRDRVSTASFFLTRSGERAYILEQLNAHFGDRYTVMDEFLDVYVKVRDLDVADRRWLLQFLDELVNPSVKLSVAEWFHFVEKIVVRGILGMRAGMKLRDTFNDRNVKLDGRIKLDGRTKNATVKLRPKLDGRAKLDGSIDLSGALLVLPATGTVRVPARLGRGILDMPGLAVKPVRHDQYTARIKLNGAVSLDGGETLSGYGRINGKLAMRPQMIVHSAFFGISESARMAVKTGPFDRYLMPFKLDGVSRLDGGAKLDGKRGVLAKCTAAARAGFQDACTASDRLNAGMRYCHRLDGRYRLDGSIKLNGGILLAV
ncbi:MAG: hypothetical protein LBK61_11165 [Spirochaetaceae bacterium]|jgi:hypothetical protein|nr:hypothetical protein [Spirochaetaceae bacterium]